MAEVLVVVEQAGGAVKKVDAGDADHGPRAGHAGGGRAGRAGHGRVDRRTSSPSTAPRRSTSPRATRSTATWSAPKAAVLADADRARSSPAAVLIGSTQEGKEIAGRVAVKLDNGLLTDVARAGRRRHRHAGDLRRIHRRQVQGHPRSAAGHRTPELADADSGAGRRHVETPVDVTVDDAAKLVKVI